MNKLQRAGIFYDVLGFLADQGKAAVNNSGDCTYRGTDGSKCAIGFLIKDEHYKKVLERKSIHNTKVAIAVEKSLGLELDYDDTSFLEDLQIAHDVYYAKADESGNPFKDFCDQMKAVANTWNISVTGLGI